MKFYLARWSNNTISITVAQTKHQAVYNMDMIGDYSEIVSIKPIPLSYIENLTLDFDTRFSVYTDLTPDPFMLETLEGIEE